MSLLIVIGGDKASGKSTAMSNVKPPLVKKEIKGLDPETTYLFNVWGKPLASKYLEKNYIKGKNRLDGHNYINIKKVMSAISKGKKFKTIVVDDFQYLMSLDYFEKKDIAGFGKFAEIGFSIVELLVKTLKMREDLTIYLLTHTDESIDAKGKTFIKLKTIGKMLDDTFSFSGMFTWIIESRVMWDEIEDRATYKFCVDKDSSYSVARTPIDVFIDEEGKKMKYIPNDLGIVENVVRDYKN